MNDNEQSGFPKRRQRLTRPQAQAILDEWQGENVSLAQFARERGFHANTLYAWRQRLFQSQDDSRAPAFAQVSVFQDTSGPRIVLPSGVCVDLPTAWSPAQIAALCAALVC